jgi:hypothetical protein
MENEENKPSLVVITLALEMDTKSATILGTDIAPEQVPGVLEVLRGIEGDLIKKLIGPSQT